VNFKKALKELEELYFLPEEEVRRIFEETASEFLSRVFKHDVDFVLSDPPRFYIYKPHEVVEEPVDKLKKSLVKGIISQVKKELKRRYEIEFLWKIYRKVKRRIKTLVEGRILGKNGNSYYMEIFIEDDENPLKPLRLIGICPLMDTTFSDRKNFKPGMRKLFLIKNCYAEAVGSTMRLTVVLSRQSRSFIKKLFESHGVPEEEIIRIERKPYKVIVYSRSRISKEVIRSVGREIDEGVIVRYEKKGW